MKQMTALLNNPLLTKEQRDNLKRAIKLANPGKSVHEKWLDGLNKSDAKQVAKYQ